MQQNVQTTPSQDFTVKASYILLALGFFFLLPIFLSVLLAYLSRCRGSELERKHLQYIINIFWLSILYAILSIIILLIGSSINSLWPLLLIVVMEIHLIFKTIRGIIHFGESREP